MDEIGITWSWLGAYALAGLLGFLGGKVIDKALAAALRRRFLLNTDLRRAARKTPKDTEESFDLIKDTAEKNKLKSSRVDLKRELKRQRIACNK